MGCTGYFRVIFLKSKIYFLMVIHKGVKISEVLYCTSSNTAKKLVAINVDHRNKMSLRAQEGGFGG